MDHKNKHKNNEFDQADLEAKLEKDNKLLKDQIQRLQDTIKNLKYEVPQTEETIDENSPEGKANNFISSIPYKTRDSKMTSPSKKGNYNTNHPYSNKLIDTELEPNDLMFSFNINSQNHRTANVQNNHTQSNGSHRNQIREEIGTERNGAFNTVDYSSDDFDEMLRTKNNLYENEILNKHSKTMKKQNVGTKPLNRHASQKVIAQVNEAEHVRKHQRHNSLSSGLMLSGKSKEKNQKLIRQYSTMNKKVVEKLQCKTQENNESLENNGKTQRMMLNANVINKAKIKLKIPNKAKDSKISSSTYNTHNTYKLNNSSKQSNALINSNESTNLALIDNLKREVLRLNMENKKLKEELDESRSMNLKFKDFAQDLMKFYEKPIENKLKK
jgi:hypothetical protein